MLPGASKPVVAVRFCPMAFSLRESDSGIHSVCFMEWIIADQKCDV